MVCPELLCTSSFVSVTPSLSERLLSSRETLPPSRFTRIPPVLPLVTPCSVRSSLFPSNLVLVLWEPFSMVSNVLLSTFSSLPEMFTCQRVWMFLALPVMSAGHSLLETSERDLLSLEVTSLELSTRTRLSTPTRSSAHLMFSVPPPRSTPSTPMERIPSPSMMLLWKFTTRAKTRHTSLPSPTSGLSVAHVLSPRSSQVTNLLSPVSVSLMDFSHLCSVEHALSQVLSVAERLLSPSLFPSFPTPMLLSTSVAESVVMRWLKCCVISLNSP
mmetsp:Transcript_22768/g.37712  ORF Transcript_22768/g.37712 Transcript_22768/m.37712 type:complete len:272 (+) Transcript_22768:108-923(+)